MAVSSSDDSRGELFVQLFAQNRLKIFTYIQSLLPNRADAEDVFQRVSILLWKKFAEFDSEREFFSWACGVAYYEVRNFIRVAARDRMQFDEQLIESLAERRANLLSSVQEKIELLKDCLSQLKPDDKSLLIKAYQEGVSFESLANERNVTLHSFYNRLSQLRRRLFHCVQLKLSVDGRSA
jgi:RNA polymerase sigma-70 factor, Rhodopirellula/Verrucomicrobium family